MIESPWPELSAETVRQYVSMRKLPDGRIVGVHRLMFHWTLHVDIEESGHADRYCYDTMNNAIIGMVGWDGTGDPVGWHKHVGTGRRRHPPTGTEWHESQITPKVVEDYERVVRELSNVREAEVKACQEPSAADQGTATPTSPRSVPGD